MKNKSLKIAAGIFLFIFVLGCGGTIDKKINLKTLNNDIKKLKESHGNVYSDSDFERLNGVLMNKVIGGLLFGEKMDNYLSSNLDKTYREYLDEAKTIRIKSEKSKSLYNENLDAFNKKIKCSVLSKSSKDGYNFDKWITFNALLENKSGKDVAAVLGYLEVYNLLDKQMAIIDVENTKELKGSGKQDLELLHIGEYRDGKELAEIDLSKLRIVWVLEKVVYSDGTKDDKPILQDN